MDMTGMRWLWNLTRAVRDERRWLAPGRVTKKMAEHRNQMSSLGIGTV
jgi:hypothetical protein